jgi:E3 ubiquitin-protein ligase UBR1
VQLFFGLAQPSMWPQGPSGLAGSRALFASRASSSTLDTDIATAREVFPDVRWTTANIIGLVGYARGNITLGADHLDDDTLAKLLCTHSLPFLRRAAVLRAAVLGTEGGANVGPQESGSEYLRLMRYLKVPLPSVALPARSERQTPLAGLIEGWIKHAYVVLAALFRPLPIHYSSHNAIGVGGFSSPYLPNSSTHPTLQLELPQVYELVDLPDDLATLLQETQERTCKRCGEVPADPALCLLCGEILCYQSFCCQSEDGKRGECNRHMDDCGGSMGIYFKVKTNIVLLLFEQNGTFLLSPYLDSHGEVDINLRKGRPQRLHRQRYDELRKNWLQHGISNLVARKIEAAMDNGGWGTF